MDSSNFDEALQKAIKKTQKLQSCKVYELNFTIHYDTQFGEKIVITGDQDFLGNWDVFKGLELEWNPNNIWKVSIPISEGELKDFEYKYVCLRPTGTFKWEEGLNRKFKVQEGTQAGCKVLFDKQDVWQKL